MGSILNSNQYNYRYYLWLLAVCLILFVANLDVVYVNIMEARNFISAREMLTHNNWLHTTLNLEPRYEKPPLPTWLTAISMWLFGKTSLYGLRLPAVLAVITLIFTSAKLMTFITKNSKHALFSSLILATSFYIIFSGRNGQWDIFAHSFMLLAITQIYQALISQSNNLKPWLFAGIFMGLSILSKGPVSLFALFLPFLIAYFGVYRSEGFKKHLKPIFLALIVAFIIGSWWAVYIYFTDTEALQIIADKETTAWRNRNVRPWYYYWSFFIQSGMWAYFAFISLLYPYMIKRVENIKAYKFSLIWTISAVILLSLIPEKKSRYLLPVLIPLAFTTSFYIKFIITQVKTLSKTDTFLAKFGFGLLALICLAVPVVSYFKLPMLLVGDIHYLLLSVFLICIGLTLIYNMVKNNFKHSFYLAVTMMCGIILFGLPLLKEFYDNPNFKNINEIRQDPQTKSISLFVQGYLAPEFIWELGEPITRIKSPKELPSQNKIGLFIADSLPKTYLKTHKIILQQDYDLNYFMNKSGKRKSRLITHFYLLEKKQVSAGY